ncbi:MAG: hypothetical protein HKO94_08305 [Flavobacteriaceae bacterium]|nr:hypothetical protein [Flavobacteriaceae bacterium]
MKKTLLFFLIPFLFAFQCDDDLENSGFETSYIIQNNSTVELFLLNEANSFVEIESQSNSSVGSTLNSETSPVVPSESFVFNTIKLYKADNGDFLQVYVQDPLDDSLWIFSEPVMNRFEYTLVITDDLLN